MYEKQITQLHRFNFEDPDFQETIDAAIALMRAAEPKDEASEREHCTREWSRVDKDKTVGVVTWLMELRAAARAEVEAKYQAAAVHEHGKSYVKGVREAVEAADRLHAAEIAEARAALRTHSENEGKLQARIAETELALTRVRGVLTADHEQFRRSQAVINELQTKLTALREAAERVDQWFTIATRVDNAESWYALRAAIEASKK